MLPQKPMSRFTVLGGVDLTGDLHVSKAQMEKVEYTLHIVDAFQSNRVKNNNAAVQLNATPHKVANTHK